jgi:hypothetical protein
MRRYHLLVYNLHVTQNGCQIVHVCGLCKQYIIAVCQFLHGLCTSNYSLTITRTKKSISFKHSMLKIRLITVHRENFLISMTKTEAIGGMRNFSEISWNYKISGKCFILRHFAIAKFQIHPNKFRLCCNIIRG